MRVRFINRGKVISCSGDEDIITWMRRNDVEAFSNNELFMEAYAERKKFFHNIHISTKDTDSFVSDLKKNRIIEIVRNPLRISFMRKRP